jgi:two-component system chemotaxis response regulator CheB
VITQDQPPVRVLVVDDSEVFRHVVCDLVAATPGFEVIADAASGREALALVGSMAAQLVMLDVHMPELDGIETASRIRRQYPDVVVLLLTATKREQLSDPSLTIEDKRNLSCQLLAEFWRRHCPDG